MISNINENVVDKIDRCVYLEYSRCMNNTECSTCGKYYEYKQVKEFEYKQRLKKKVLIYDS